MPDEGSQHSEPRTSAEGDDAAARGFWLASLGLFVFALGLRALHVWQLSRAPFFDLQLGDARSYHRWALEIASGNWLGDTVFYQAPLYPYFLGSVYALIGVDAWTVRLSQALLGAASCVLLADAGRRIFSAGAGIAAGALLAVYAPALFFDGLIQKASLGLLLFCLALWAIALVMQRPRFGASLLLGLALGALVLTRENALAIAGVVLLWMLLPFRPDPRRWLHAAALLLGLGLALVPVTLRNWSVSGEWHLTTSQLGPNFYIGNNRDATGLYSPLRRGRGDPLAEQRDARELAERALGQQLGPAEVSRYWTSRALDDIRAEPGRWLRLLGSKLALAWNAGEVGDTEFQQEHASWSPVLRIAGAVAHFGVLAPLAALGLWATWRERRRLWLFYLLLAAYTVSVAAFYVFARYRYPLVPVLALFGGAGLVGARQRLHALSRSQLAALGSTLLVFAVFCNWPQPATRPPGWVSPYNLGSAQLATGDPLAAEASFREALLLDADELLVHTQLGIALQAQGRNQAAAEQFRSALEIDEDFFDAHIGISRCLVALGREPEALSHLRRAGQLEPGSARPLNNASWLLATSTRIDARTAERSLRMAVQASRLSGGRNPEILDTLAAAHAANGQFEAAITQAEAARAAAVAAGDAALAEQVSQRLALYRTGQRYVAPVSQPGNAPESR